jgi:hypothetical protein
MHDTAISRTTALSILLWGVAAGLILSGWVVMLFDPDGWRWSVMLTSTGLAVTGVAMTVHQRIYALRVICLIRATSGLTQSPRRELHSIP